MLYSTRTTMPLLVPAVAAEMKWSKTDSGTVLSSFFWGYTLTQVSGKKISETEQKVYISNNSFLYIELTRN